MAQNDSRDFDGADLVAGFGVEDDDVRVLVTEAAGVLGCHVWQEPDSQIATVWAGCDEFLIPFPVLFESGLGHIVATAEMIFGKTGLQSTCPAHRAISGVQCHEGSRCGFARGKFGLICAG